MKEFWSNHHGAFCNVLLHHFGPSVDEEKSMRGALQSLEALEDFPQIIQEDVYFSLSDAISRPPEAPFSDPVMRQFLRLLWHKPQCRRWMGTHLEHAVANHSKHRAFIEVWKWDTLTRWLGWITSWERQEEEEKALVQAAGVVRKESAPMNARPAEVSDRRTRLV